MRFKYMHETIYGSADDILKRVNELGNEGWEVVHVSTVTTESNMMHPAHMIWLKQEDMSSPYVSTEEDISETPGRVTNVKRKR